MFRRRQNKDYDEYIDYDSSQEPSHDEELSNQQESWNTESNYYDLDDDYPTTENDHNNQYAQDLDRNDYYNDDDYGNQPLQYPRQESHEPTLDSRRLRREAPQESLEELQGQRSRYNARIDRFLNNGIIIVGVLLIIVLVIAFML